MSALELEGLLVSAGAVMPPGVSRPKLSPIMLLHRAGWTGRIERKAIAGRSDHWRELQTTLGLGRLPDERQCERWWRDPHYQCVIKPGCWAAPRPFYELQPLYEDEIAPSGAVS